MSIALSLTALAVLTGAVYVERIDRYQYIVSSTVRAEMEDTPQRYKVLEAFILSAADADLHSLVKKASISREFTERLNTLDKVLGDSAHVEPPGDLHISKPDGVDQQWAQYAQNAILTDGQDPGYLFFPLTLLRTRFDHKAYAQLLDNNDNSRKVLRDAAMADSVIGDDIAISRRLVATMSEIAKTPLFTSDSNRLKVGLEEYPVQIYYITKNGVNRIVNNSARNQRIVYQNLFRATTFFPSRPYFIEAFKRGEPETLKNVSGLVENSFYVSQPYLDIGGFGVVITLSRAIRYGGHSDAAICFDLKLNSPVSFKLKEKLRSLGAEHQAVTCNIGFNGKFDCQPRNEPKDSSLDEVQADLKRNLRKGMASGDLSTVVGNINIFAKPEFAIQPAGFLELLAYPYKLLTGEGTTPISFSIPLRSPSALDDKTLQAEFLLGSLNLGRFAQITSAIGLASILLLTTAFFVVVLSWQREVQNRSGWQSAFAVFDGVMYAATTAYCRLDSDDRIVDCNTAFAALLNKPADKHSVDWLIGQTLESHIAPRSKGTYQDVQRRRRSGDNVAPYTLFLAREDGSELETRVTSGQIPSNKAGQLPETFGLMIPSSSPPAQG